MNLPTLVIVLVLLAAVILAVRSIVRDRKKGGCSGCPGGCSCGSHTKQNGCCH